MLRPIAALALLLSTTSLCAQTPAKEARTAAGRLVVFYREGYRVSAQLPRLRASVLRVAPGTEESTLEELRRRPEVEAVLRDRYVAGHGLPVRPLALTPEAPPARLAPGPRRGGIASIALADATYLSAQGWAVRQAGGFGANLPGGPAVGPWNSSLGAGVRIAILDSGVDAHHPDLAASLTLNLSEVDQTALPSACDDGSPQDQQGHGTFAASLAAAAVGGGDILGVAPQATLLNIKVLQRMPGTGATPTAQCEAGEPGGLLSWVLAGIEDAIAQHADVLSLSLGSLVDISTGDGAGWKAAFDRATYAAQQAGIVTIAAAGNDGLDLSGGTLVELPAQARGVLAVTASTNPDCAENLAANASCKTGGVTRTSYSNYGIANAIAAPGGNLPGGPDNGLSGMIRGACSSGVVGTSDGLPASGKSFGCFGLGHVAYVQAMGTSASAPLVAGAAAILHAARPDLTAAQIVAALRTAATVLPTMAEPIINLPAALAAN